MVSKRSVRFPHLAAAGAAAALALAAPAAQAALIADPVGDFLSTFAGPHNGDLDVVSAQPTLHGTELTLTATLDGAIGTTPDALYVWGVDRGGGQPLFQFSAPQIGAGVLFDSVVLLQPDLTGAVVLILPSMVVTPLPAGSVTVSGNTITGTLDISMLPGNGAAFEDYGYNLWPRTGLGDNTQVADFAPDASTVTASIPEPAAWALMVAGFGLVGLAARRRTRALAHA